MIMSATHLNRPYLLRSIIMFPMACGLLTSCHSESLRPAELRDNRFSTSSCAMTRYNGSLSAYGETGFRVDFSGR
jgi:hypothetical protein